MGPNQTFDSLLPRPGDGLRLLKAKLDLKLGASGVLCPFQANTQREIERKILLQNTLGGGGATPTNPPVTDTLASAALGYWRMDGAQGDNELDTTGNGHNVIESASVIRSTGTAGLARIGTARYVDYFGFSPIFEVDKSIDQRGTSAPFTVAGWIQEGGGSGNGAPMVGAWGTNHDWIVTWNGAVPKHVYLNWQDDTGTDHFFLSTDALTGGSITDFMVICFNGSAISLQINLGTKDSQNTTGCQRGRENLGWGMYTNHPANFNDPGCWEEFGYYNRELTPTELSYLYNAGAAKRPVGL